jgi:type III secretion protein L
MAFGVSSSHLIPRIAIAGSQQAGIKVIPAADLKAVRDAEAIVAQAWEDADRIMAESRQAYESERQRGYQEGLELARAEQALHMIDNVARSVDFLGKVEARMVDLVMQAVRKIIDGFDDRSRVLMTVRSVLAAARTQKQMTLRLNPDQVEVVRGQLTELLATFPSVDFLDIVGDARLKADACVLESDIGLVEASTETQLEALRSAFLGTLGERA